MKPYASLNKFNLLKIARSRGYSHLSGHSKQSLIAMMEAYDRERSLLKGRSNHDLRQWAEGRDIKRTRGMRREGLVQALMKSWVLEHRGEADNAAPPLRAGLQVPLDQAAFERRFYECGFADGNLNKAVQASDIRTESGGHLADLKLDLVAELYLDATPPQRQRMRDCFNGIDTWPLVKYVRRVAERIHSPADLGWLRYGLAIASLENARWDYRDLIVSMVILRFAAERVPIDTTPYFNEIIEISDQKVRPMLENARDHAQSDIRNTVKAFGPRGWVVE